MKKPIKTEDRTIATRMRSFDAVDAAIRAPGLEAADVLNARYAEDASTVDYHQFFANLGKDLTGSHWKMLTANTVHQGNLARIVELAARRDRFSERLFEAFIQARHVLERLYGNIRGFSVVGVAGPTLRDPSGLIKQVRETIEFLEDPKVNLPEFSNFAVNHPGLAVDLRTGAEALAEVLAEIALARKRAEATRLTKNEAIKDYDRMFLYVARVLEGLFNLAGMTDAAERVRPSTRRPGTRAADNAEPEEQEASETPPADSDEAASEAPPADEASPDASAADKPPADGTSNGRSSPDKPG